MYDTHASCEFAAHFCALVRVRAAPIILYKYGADTHCSSADLLLLSRAARLDRGRGLLIANVDDAPRDALSERELQDLRKTAESHARSYFGRSTARARPQPCRTCS